MEVICSFVQEKWDFASRVWERGNCPEEGFAPLISALINSEGAWPWGVLSCAQESSPTSAAQPWSSLSPEKKDGAERNKKSTCGSMRLRNHQGQGFSLQLFYLEVGDSPAWSSCRMVRAFSSHLSSHVVGGPAMGVREPAPRLGWTTGL